MLGQIELLVIFFVILFLFRTDEYSDSIKGFKHLKAAVNEVKSAVTQSVIQPVRDSWQEVKRNGTTGERNDPSHRG
ncbi:MAG: hypothetical protein OEM52_11150 [bacterium]|nr:hypothetical protein [bacterium]